MIEHRKRSERETRNPFFKAGILREAFCGGYYSILTSPEKQDLCALCFYSGKRETQCAFAPGTPGYFVSLDEKSHVVFGGIEYYCQV